MVKFKWNNKEDTAIEKKLKIKNAPIKNILGLKYFVANSARSTVTKVPTKLDMRIKTIMVPNLQFYF